MAIRAVKRKSTKVKEAEIESKDQRWHCRNRVTLVFGSNDLEELNTYIYTPEGIDFQSVNFHQAKSKAIEEILDNCIDEFYRGYVTEVRTSLMDDGQTVVVEDNGIGFPLAKVKDVYTQFRTGSKFKDEEVDSKGYLNRTLGQNGLGASATCLTSDSFKVTVKHFNSKKTQTYTFLDGALKTKKSQAKKFSGASGVRVEFVLAKEVYKNSKIDKVLLRKRIIDLAYNNPGLTFTFNDEKFHFKKGLFELATVINPETAQIFGEKSYTFEGVSLRKKKFKAKIDLHLSIVIDKKSEDREKIISFVNSTPTYDGGFHHDRIKRIIINSLKDKLERAAKKEKLSIHDNDILTGLYFVIGIIMPNPRFESQTKRKLVRDEFLEKGIEQFISDHIDKFMRKNKEYLDLIIDRAKSRHRFQELKDASKAARRAKKQRVDKLLDANERRNRQNCMLFICEGDSAIGGLRSARDRLIQGGIALRGKPLNVSQASIKDIINNEELSNIMASIGLTLGQESDPAKLRYSKIIFLADSDVDGGHINTLLTNFFFTYWPEMFQRGQIQIAKAPLFEVITDKGTHYVESESELEKFKQGKTHKIKEIQRNKGLGEMSKEAFQYILSKKDYTKINIEDASSAKDMLQVCFGKDSGPRKELLMDENKTAVEYKRASKQTTKTVVKTTTKKAVVSKKKVAKVTKKKVAKATKKKVAKTTKKKVTKKITKKVAKTTKKKVTKKKTSRRK
ncbi:toprim domain-containing protein [Bacteriovoracaceae bacterium]|nr:toprim domain-containing protein [Bacteriovoracaceae bacterium]